MCTDRTNFDVTMGRLQNKGYFQEVNTSSQTVVFYMLFVVLHYIHTNSLEMMWSFRPASSDVKIGPARAYENRLHEATPNIILV